VTFPAFTHLRDQANVWILPDGYVSELHFDLSHNLNTVLRGEKDVILLPPEETRNLYPVGAQNSRVRLFDIAAEFHRVRRARYWKTTLGAGDTLYIPPFYWHHVRSRGESVAVNVWFHREVSRLRRMARWPRRVIVAAVLSRLRSTAGRGYFATSAT
jgi:lysine-specific demethylase 8